MASVLKVDAIQTTEGKNIVNSTGSVLQVLQSTKTDVQTVQSQTFVDISDLNVTITPSSTSSKFLLTSYIPTSSNGHYDLRLVRTVSGTTTALFIGDAAGSRIRSTHHGYIVTNFNTSYDMHPISMSYLDSPNTTSAITYGVQGSSAYSSAYFIEINEQHSEADSSYAGRTAASFTVMEIAG